MVFEKSSVPILLLLHIGIHTMYRWRPRWRVSTMSTRALKKRRDADGFNFSFFFRDVLLS